MVENVGRKLTLIGTLLGLSVMFMVLPKWGFQLGLDLKGGTRLVYKLEFEEALESGQLTANENPADIAAQTISIIRSRIDNSGIKEPVIRAEGENRIVVEIAGNLDQGSQEITGSLGASLAAADKRLTLTPDLAPEFPENGGVIRIGGEDIRYGQRRGLELVELSRAHYGGVPEDHETGADVLLVSADEIRGAIENLGNLAFMIVANSGDFLEVDDTDFTQEEQRMRNWITERPGARLVDFNRIKYEDGGPHPSIEWHPRKPLSEAEELLAESDRAMAVLVQPNEDWQFSGADLSTVFPTVDDVGYPAVGFEMQTQRKGDFGDFTEENVNRPMAIILNGQVESFPNINGKLPGRGVIQGRFAYEEVVELVTILRSGSLRIRPQLDYEEKIGATLGADYISRGFYSGLLAVLIVLVFMVVYYRKLGIFASLSLVANIVLVMGALSFLRATLTLPGIAGLILTVGMAVDANILIFDRIREELDKGRNVKQGAKSGFDKALSAILDANITTFLTGLILYQVGTGPVRGFAVTLMIGIVASVFAALVITRLLVHMSLESGTRSFQVGQWMVKANYRFLSKAKFAFMVSGLLVALSLGAFIMTPKSDAYGIDFLGGSEVHFRLQEARDVEALRDQLSNAGMKDVDLKPILSSGSGDGYLEFRASTKAAGETEGELAKTGQDFEARLRTSLAGTILESPISLTTLPEGSEVRLAATIRTVAPHSDDDVANALTTGGLRDVNVQSDAGGNYTVSALTNAGRTTREISDQIRNSLDAESDSNADPFVLASPIAGLSTVGPQVVGQLKQKAFLAILISLFAVVLYIRVRFAEYSFGAAAVVALVHDVLITLGALLLFTKLGVLNGEINLPMIAAFLTIIGYSLNDTIVIFDRVRENLPRMKTSLGDVLDRSINQTLSRTVLTSVTTFMAVSLLFFFNFGTGNVLETFSFAMMIGVISGTYSTVFIANPVLLWWESKWGHLQVGVAPKVEDKKALEGAAS